jgi:endo-1,4-beta-xylanase
MKSQLKPVVMLIIVCLVLSIVSAQPKKPTGQPLRVLAAKQNMLFGAAIDPWRIKQPALSNIIIREFSSITTENEMKCAMISRGRDEYHFKPADDVVDFARKHNIKVRGHTLIWHQSTPVWLKKEKWTKESLLAWLKEYITTVVTHFKGKVYAWDVVNEVFLPNGRFMDAYRSIWYKVCGEEYIEKAFIWARAADPKAKLYINDVSIIFKNRQSNAIYEWIKNAKERDIPIDGIGFQAHITEGPKIDYGNIRSNLNRFRDLGLELQITEMDVRIDGPPSEEKLANQARIFADFVKLAIEYGMPVFTTWGVSDKDSWIPQHFPGFGAALLFDKEFNPKPAYYAVQRALAAAPTKKKK